MSDFELFAESNLTWEPVPPKANSIYVISTILSVIKYLYQAKFKSSFLSVSPQERECY